MRVFCQYTRNQWSLVIADIIDDNHQIISRITFGEQFTQESLHCPLGLGGRHLVIHTIGGEVQGHQKGAVSYSHPVRESLLVVL